MCILAAQKVTTAIRLHNEYKDCGPQGHNTVESHIWL